VQRTQVAVARALQDDADVRVLFFDEPTATLPGSEVDRLFAVIRSMVDLGISVVYVSHRLEELPRIADRVTVLRDGHVAGSGAQTEFTRERLVDLIVGEARRQPVPPARPRGPGRTLPWRRGRPVPAWSSSKVSAGELTDASFRGSTPERSSAMAGLVGSGVDDVSRVLIGSVRAELRSHPGGRERAGAPPSP
jgi:ribose transport system ATP-binding protein